MSTVETPCIKVCILDPQSRLCRGCGRTIDEITAWGSLSDSERRRIIALLPERLKSLPAGAPALTVS